MSVDLMPAIDVKDRLIVALDVSGIDAARAVVAKLGDTVSFYKVGYQQLYSGGFPLIGELVGAGKKVFVDLKLHDIPHTVEMAVAEIARLGATFLTVHAYPQTLVAAVTGRGDSALKILGVTVMTSMNDQDLAMAGYAVGVSDLVMKRARQTLDAGADGVIASAHEVAVVRQAVGTDLLVVTPGIRPVGAEVGDQKRVVTPAAAIGLGVDYMVVGRPVVASADPASAARAIQKEITAA